MGRARAYILENFKVDYKKYDIIIGYRANDSYFSYAGDFVNGTLAASTVRLRLNRWRKARYT